MNTRPAGALLLLPFSVFCLVAAACSRDVSGPGDAASAGVVRALAAPAPAPPPPPSPTCYDSVYTGYGSGSTGGLEYESFEYEPETGTEYVATCDTTP
jgi:hypothetical protein